MEIDGDRIRAMVRDVAERAAQAERSEKALLELAARSPDARALVFREADRAHRAARLRHDDAGAEELGATQGGAPLDPAGQARLAEIVRVRIESGRARDALAQLLTKLR